MNKNTQKSSARIILILGIILIAIGALFYITKDSAYHIAYKYQYDYVLGGGSLNEEKWQAYRALADFENKYSIPIAVGGVLFVVVSFFIRISNNQNIGYCNSNQVPYSKSVYNGDTLIMQQRQPENTDNQWICSCGAVNDGNFCSKCGTSRV